jgi:alkanesulfonate monooxygenase SsuD/methylene tetrahydromethanopterin reductase-like flavin-dependent oxidoreductase (luciferase family)
MKIGIGLPTALPGVDGPALLHWARRAEDRGFSTLATVDRLVYDSYDPLTVLAAAAAVTTRTLATMVLLAPLHTNHVGLAKPGRLPRRERFIAPQGATRCPGWSDTN